MTYIDLIDDVFPVRHSVEQKRNFQNFIKQNITELPVHVSKNGKNENIIIGDIQQAKVVIGAHYDTPSASLFPNIIFPTSTIAKIIYLLLTNSIIVLFSLLVGLVVYHAFNIAYYISIPIAYVLASILIYQTIPNEHNLNDNTSGVATILSIIKTSKHLDDVAFVLFDNEEKGKLGSASLSKAHTFLNNKLVINLDCVGNGEEFIFISKCNYDIEEFNVLKSLNTPKFRFITHKDGKVNSDYLSFKYGVSCVAVCHKKNIEYVPSIHTNADNYVDENNIQSLTEFINNFLKEINHGN